MLGLSACAGSKPAGYSVSAPEPAERFEQPAPLREHCEPSEQVQDMPRLVAKEELSENNVPEPVGGPGALLANMSYPREARRAGIEGTVWLSLVVTEDGETLDVRVCQSSGHEALDRQALQALEQSEWHPGTVEGEPVPVAMRFPAWFGIN